MVTINSISGGQTSAYMMTHFPADYNVFSLVRINQPSAAPRDPWMKKYVESKLGMEFIATAEMDEIVYTMADLEQFTGREITWIPSPTFDEITERPKVLPSPVRRFCTQLLKVEPIAQWVFDTIGEPVEMRLGFRANEIHRAERSLERCNANGLIEARVSMPQKKNPDKMIGRMWPFQKPSFPLIENRIFKDQVNEFWRNKPVRFAERNNCIGCFHRNPILLNLMAKKHPEKFQWFVDLENRKMNQLNSKGKSMAHWNTFRRDATYEQIRNHRTQLSFDDLDGFTDCDSGFCGM